MATIVKTTFNSLLRPNHLLESIIILMECSLDKVLQNSFKEEMICQKTWLLLETHFLFIMVESKIVLYFRLVQGRLLWVKYFTSQYELLPFVPLCHLIAKMHNTSKFWSIKFMDANFFYYSIYDRFIQRQLCMTCICKLFLLKLLLRND